MTNKMNRKKMRIARSSRLICNAMTATLFPSAERIGLIQHVLFVYISHAVISLYFIT